MKTTLRRLLTVNPVDLILTLAFTTWMLAFPTERTYGYGDFLWWGFNSFEGILGTVCRYMMLASAFLIPVYFVTNMCHSNQQRRRHTRTTWTPPSKQRRLQYSLSTCCVMMLHAAVLLPFILVACDYGIRVMLASICGSAAYILITAEVLEHLRATPRRHH